MMSAWNNGPGNRRIHPLCALCTNFGRVRAAKVLATIPMCGERPRYPLCVQCLTELAAEVGDVESVATMYSINPTGSI